MYGKECNVWVFVGKYPEYLIRKSLSDCGNSSKIKENSLKQVEPSDHPLGLRT